MQSIAESVGGKLSTGRLEVLSGQLGRLRHPTMD
jgi:hypothetical protein